VVPPGRSAHFLVATFRELSERQECRIKEPSEPDALAVALLTDPVHAIVPVSGTHQRQPVNADRETQIERASAMLEQSSALLGDHRMKVRFLLVVVQSGTIEKRRRLIQDREIAGDLGSNGVV
jgi:hypothetical protein